MTEHASNETFIRLLENHVKHEDGRPGNIRVPIIQRDYAQGRNNVTTKEKLDKLLADIKDAVHYGREKPLSLNFVYGKIDEGRFVPMDGQQRLTLLFLLHVYAFADDGSKTVLLKRFEYETRVSSQDFIKNLIAERNELFGGASPAATIKDSPWFLPQWDHDPTIESMLVVLDRIAAMFPTSADRSALASALQGDSITFKFLDMEKLGQPDSLYIKLNARGKQLSPFENFRAKLIARVELLDKQGVFPDRFKPYGEHGRLGSFSKCFEICLDGDWTDIFWTIAQEERKAALEKEKKDNKATPLIDYFFDGSFETFIRNILRNRTLLEGPEPDKKNAEEKKRIDVDALDAQALLDLYYTLQALRENTLRDDKHIRECMISEKYTERVLLFALTIYACQTSDDIADDRDEWNGAFEKWNDGFKKWYRVFKNLALNTQFFSLQAFYNAIRSVAQLSPQYRTIEEFFADSVTFNAEQYPRGFYDYQINEERLKAQLIVNGGEAFRKAIEKAERHSYFSGQIIGILSFAGFAIDDKENLDEKLADFEFYAGLLEILFDFDKNDKNKNKPVVNGVLFRRALLTFGDYRIKAENGDSDTFVRDAPSESTSWKGLLRPADKDKERELLKSRGRELLKELFDFLRKRPHDTLSDVETGLKEIIETSEIDKGDWRFYFVDKEQLHDVNHDANPLFFDEQYLGHKYWHSFKPKNENTIILFSGQDYRGYYSEFNLLVVYRYFKRKGSDIRLHPGLTRNEQACRIEGLKHAGEDVTVKYLYNTPGLTMERTDGTALEPPIEGKTADEIIRYLEEWPNQGI